MKTPHRGENKKAEKPALNPRLEITFCCTQYIPTHTLSSIKSSWRDSFFMIRVRLRLACEADMFYSLRTDFLKAPGLAFSGQHVFASSRGAKFTLRNRCVPGPSRIHYLLAGTSASFSARH